ncbi:MAG: RluA family pseudouridine synthase [Thermodesulfobacteriota bacterium]|nr:RluA family pseudouridine synthase [Thermodesulfobacteriota bacterium]
MNNESSKLLTYKISEDEHNIRLDRFLASQSVEISRSTIQALIRQGHVKVNLCLSKPSHKLKTGDHITLFIPPAKAYIIEPEPIDYTILYEDDSLIVVDKPAGLVVHPAPGHSKGTLAHGLLTDGRHLSSLGGALRPGIVHRLDKGTSGVMVVAKTDHCHSLLASQFKSGTVMKEYVALVHGRFKAERGEVDLPIGRHVKHRKKMSVAPAGPKRALTHWKKTEEFMCGFTLLSVNIKTGRTHQIRVHLSHIGHPIVGDPVYGHGKRWWKPHPLLKRDALPPVERQMLHSRVLKFAHPVQERQVEFVAPIPDDMKNLLNALKTEDTKIRLPSL